MTSPPTQLIRHVSTHTLLKTPLVLLGDATDHMLSRVHAHNLLINMNHNYYPPMQMNSLNKLCTIMTEFINEIYGNTLKDELMYRPSINELIDLINELIIIFYSTANFYDQLSITPQKQSFSTIGVPIL